MNSRTRENKITFLGRVNNPKRDNKRGDIRFFQNEIVIMEGTYEGKKYDRLAGDLKLFTNIVIYRSELQENTFVNQYISNIDYLFLANCKTKVFNKGKRVKIATYLKELICNNNGFEMSLSLIDDCQQKDALLGRVKLILSRLNFHENQEIDLLLKDLDELLVDLITSPRYRLVLHTIEPRYLARLKSFLFCHREVLLKKNKLSKESKNEWGWAQKIKQLNQKNNCLSFSKEEAEKGLMNFLKQKNIEGFSILKIKGNLYIFYTKRNIFLTEC